MKSENSKMCTGCKRELPVSAFYKEPRARSGLTGRCRECKRDYRLANLERERASVRNWHQRNHDSRSQYWRDWYLRDGNREVVIARAKAHYKEHYEEKKDTYVEAWRRRRARLLHAPVNDFSVSDWCDVQDYFGYRCAYCGRPGGLTMDHVQPLFFGGNHSRENVVAACRSCNSSKGSKGLLAWLHSGFAETGEIGLANFRYDRPTGRFLE